MARKKNPPNRVELSPPPVRKNHRMARSRLRGRGPAEDDTAEDSQSSQANGPESGSSDEKQDFLSSTLNLANVTEQNIQNSE